MRRGIWTRSLVVASLWAVLNASCPADAEGRSSPEICCPPPVCNRVYVIPGAAGWWPCLYTMLARLRHHGYEPDVYFFGGVNRAVDQLVERRRCGEEAGPVRIIGYSLGAHGACHMAKQLEERGIIVDRLLLVECFSNTTVAANVCCCFNIYETRMTDQWNVFRGTPVSRESPHTRLVNINVATHPDWSDQCTRNHFTMADDTRIQKMLVHLLSCDCIWREAPQARLCD